MHQPLVVQIFIVVGFDIDAGGISGFCQTPARSASKMVPRRNSRMKWMMLSLAAAAHYFSNWKSLFPVGATVDDLLSSVLVS